MRANQGEGRPPVVPAQAGTSHPCPGVDEGEAVRSLLPRGEKARMRVRFTPRGVNPQTNDNCSLRHSPADCYITRTRHASEGWHPECATAHTVGRARMRVTARQNGVTPLRHASEGWHPECATAHTPNDDAPRETTYVVAGRRTLLSREYISVIGRVSRGITGRTGDHLGLSIPYPTGPTNCLARTRSTGSR